MFADAIQILQPSSRECVKGNDLGLLPQQALHKVGTDETGTPGDQIAAHRALTTRAWLPLNRVTHTRLAPTFNGPASLTPTRAIDTA